MLGSHIVAIMVMVEIGGMISSTQLLLRFPDLGFQQCQLSLLITPAMDAVYAKFQSQLDKVRRRGVEASCSTSSAASDDSEDFTWILCFCT